MRDFLFLVMLATVIVLATPPASTEDITPCDGGSCVVHIVEPHPCDCNRDGVVNAVDVQLVINAALGRD